MTSDLPYDGIKSINGLVWSCQKLYDFIKLVGHLQEHLNRAVKHGSYPQIACLHVPGTSTHATKSAGQHARLSCQQRNGRWWLLRTCISTWRLNILAEEIGVIPVSSVKGSIQPRTGNALRSYTGRRYSSFLICPFSSVCALRCCGNRQPNTHAGNISKYRMN